jgi:hypothetical protein
MTERRVALIIASYQYEDPDLQQLVAPAQDAEALARVLEDPAMGGFEVQTLLNEPSYRVNQEIEAFFADRGRDDLCAVFLARSKIRVYFAASDTRRKMLRTTAIPATLVNDLMYASRSRRQVLLLDCCYSGAFARGLVAKADRAIGTMEHFRGRGRIVLTASDAMQYAFEGDQVAGEGVRSVFTRTLVQGLESGEADLDRDGYISLVSFMTSPVVEPPSADAGSGRSTCRATFSSRGIRAPSQQQSAAPLQSLARHIGQSRQAWWRRERPQGTLGSQSDLPSPLNPSALH